MLCRLDLNNDDDIGATCFKMHFIKYEYNLFFPDLRRVEKLGIYFHVCYLKNQAFFVDWKKIFNW